MQFELIDKISIITGAAHGIGRAELVLARHDRNLRHGTGQRAPAPQQRCRPMTRVRGPLG